MLFVLEALMCTMRVSLFEGVAEVEILIVDSECFTGNEGVDKGHATELLRVGSQGSAGNPCCDQLAFDR
jgi:hypothetical protein